MNAPAINIGPNVEIVHGLFADWCVYVLVGGYTGPRWEQYASHLTKEDALAVAQECARINAKFGGRPTDGYEE